jgi:hypothetical protein
VSFLLLFGGCVGKVEGLVWAPIVSEVSAVTEFMKYLLVRNGEEMVISGLELGGSADFSQGLNGPCYGRAGRTLLPYTHAHTHTLTTLVNLRVVIYSNSKSSYD